MGLVLFNNTTRPWGSPNLSPFAVKLETYLKLKKLPYTTQPVDMRRAPRGKIPYVQLESGELVGDSQLIIERLEKETPPALDAHLTDVQRATGRLLRRTLDEAYYFALMYDRWFHDDTWTEQRIEFAKVLPGPLRLIAPMIRRVVKKTLHSQGTGRHERGDVAAMACADWDAVSTLLGDTPYLFGSTPTTFDASLFAFLECTLCFPVKSATAAHIEQRKNLAQYRERLKKELFS